VQRQLWRDQSLKWAPRRRRLRARARELRRELQQLTPSWRSVRDLFSCYQHVFFAIQTDVPREGLPVLAAAWADHVTRASGRSCLLVRYTSIHVSRTSQDSHVDFSRKLLSAFDHAASSRDLDMHAYVIHDRLSDEVLWQIMRQSRALVSATFGEGYGGPIADAIQMCVPVIAPRHTALANFLPPNYPLIVRSEPFRGTLLGNLFEYSPSAQWHVPDALHLARLLDQLCERPCNSEDVWLPAARDALHTFCGKDAVLARVRDALAELMKV
jgi:hypothetical protein